MNVIQFRRKLSSSGFMPLTIWQWKCDRKCDLWLKWEWVSVVIEFEALFLRSYGEILQYIFFFLHVRAQSCDSRVETLGIRFSWGEWPNEWHFCQIWNILVYKVPQYFLLQIEYAYKCIRIYLPQSVPVLSYSSILIIAKNVIEELKEPTKFPLLQIKKLVISFPETKLLLNLKHWP